MFFNKQSFRRFPEIPRRYCVCLLLYPCRSEVTILSINQRVVCNSNLLAPFQTSWYPNRGILKDKYG